MEYEALEPFGSIRDDWRTGFMLSVIANMLSEKRAQPFTPIDFAPESVNGWIRAIQESGREELPGDKAPHPPTHPTIMIFDEMMKDQG